jgi:hypothetical protein
MKKLLIKIITLLKSVNNNQRITYTHKVNKDNVATITINGKTFTTKGNNISVINDKVMVDGIIIESGLSGIVKIQFEGDIANIDATSVEIVGNVTGNVGTTHLKVSGDIKGNVDTTHLNCRDIYANRVDSVHINCNSKNKLG